MISVTYSLLLALPLIPCANLAKILGICPFPSYSHHIIFQAIWQELSLRGHELTVLTPRPMHDPRLGNLTEIDISFEFDIVPENVLSYGISRIKLLYDLLQFVDKIGEKAINHPRFRNFVSNSTQRFDLIIIECYYPVLYGLSRRFGAPIVCVFSIGVPNFIQDIMGNPNHPILYRDYLSSNERQLSVLEKIATVLYNVWSSLWLHFVFRPHGQKLAEATFEQAERDFVQLERNVKMFFLNVNPVLYDARANGPAAVELGGLLEVHSKDMPSQEVQDFLDGATQGVVYVSLGSTIQIEGSSIGEKILEALANLPYKVIIKWKCETLPYKKEKMLCKKWLPQKKILAHPNLRVFVTQGGLHSVEEAIVARVPLVGIPFFADQSMNTRKFAQQGFGQALDPATLTPEQLKNTIVEVGENQKYKKKILQVRKMLLDKPMSSLDKVVWWAEYVIRHKGASHLTSLSLEMSWFSFLLGDVTALLIAVLVLIFLGFYFVIRFF